MLRLIELRLKGCDKIFFLQIRNMNLIVHLKNKENDDGKL